MRTAGQCGPSGPLGELLAIEARRDWPAGYAGYRDALEALALALEKQDPGVRWDLYAWLVSELGGLLQCRDERERRARREAIEDVAFDYEMMVPKLMRAAGRLKPARRPNLLSWLRATVLWRASDTIESLDRRHDRRLVLAPIKPLTELSLLDPRCGHSWRRLQHATELAQLLGSFDLTPVEMDAMRLLAYDSSIAEAARETGRSRQQIYRLLARIREWSALRPLLEPDPSEQVQHDSR